MSDERFKTLRHMETVRNFIGACVRELLSRAELHDQSKLEDPECEAFNRLTPLLRETTYGTDEYHKVKAGLGDALLHHYQNNRHHPEFHPNGIADMNLIDLIELLCDWKASGLRHADGDIMKSIEINQARFGYSDDLKRLLTNTAEWLNAQPVFHKAEES